MASLSACSLNLTPSAVLPPGLLDQGELLRQHIPGKTALIVTNETIAPLYLDRSAGCRPYRRIWLWLALLARHRESVGCSADGLSRRLLHRRQGSCRCHPWLACCPLPKPTLLCMPVAARTSQLMSSTPDTQVPGVSDCRCPHVSAPQNESQQPPMRRCLASVSEGGKVKAQVVILPDGEQHKSLEVLQKVWDKALECRWALISLRDRELQSGMEERVGTMQKVWDKACECRRVYHIFAV